MTAAEKFIAALHTDRLNGNVSGETEQHFKSEFRHLGRDASVEVLAGAVEAEIARLERQAATLRRLRDGLLGVW
jgi:hypothetical protein